MAWNDGITKELSDFINEISKSGDVAIETFKDTIDTAVKSYSNNLSNSVAAIHTGGTGGLKNSLTTEPVTDRGSQFYGSRVHFKGENRQGVPYEKIANVLNYGRAAGVSSSGRRYGGIAGSFFISKEVKKLKGLSKRIDDNITNKLAEIT